jgi:hypothetical protein
MEAVIDVLQAMQINISEAMVAGLFIFAIGYLIGMKKVRKLSTEIYHLQKDVLDLNEELLYGKSESETPVIGIKQEGLKNNKIAK